jgi:hypothetical protein
VSASAATTAGATNNNSSLGAYNQAPKASSASVVAAAPAATDNSDIVVRDKNGSYRIDVPILPPGELADDENDGGLDGINGADGDGKMSGREKESTFELARFRTSRSYVVRA